MILKKLYSRVFMLFVGALLLGGCSSSSDGTPAAGATDQTISGIVSDPAIEGAEVMLVRGDGSLTGISGRSGADGRFTLAGAPLDLKGYRLKTASGADTGTGQDLRTIELCLPLALFTAFDKVVVSPLTCIVQAAFDGTDINAAVTAVKGKLGDLNLSADPAVDLKSAVIAMKLTAILAEGKSAKDIWQGLDTTPGVDDTDLSTIFGAGETLGRLKSLFSAIDAAANASGATVADVAALIQKLSIEAAIRESLAKGLAALTDPAEIAQADANIDALVTHLMGMKGNAARSYLMKVDVVSTISSGGGICFADVRNLPCAPTRKIISDTFDPVVFIKQLILVNRDSEFVDSLKLAYYRVDNPVTGNQQLVVYDGVTQQQTVVKTNVIIGGRAFVLEGRKEGDKNIITGKKYGIFLDPNQSRETRTAPDGRGGFFEYVFFFDNAFKRYDVGSPSNERTIFDSAMLTQALKDQGIVRVSSEYTLFNNTNDPDNSYVELAAFESLPDPLKGETGANKSQTSLVARLVDGRMTQGRLLGILKDGAGMTSRVLLSFEAVHTPSASAVFERKLQVCPPDLSGCADVANGGGAFYFMTENDTHIYLAKQGAQNLYAFDKGAESLAVVSGVTYPAAFDSARHLASAGGHGGGGILSDFSSIAGANTHLGGGADAYLAINYDLDRDTKLGSFMFLGDIFMQKHGQILKFTGTSGMKMFDNGDGIDHGDASEGEAATGHLNLIAAVNGRLFVEIANYDATSAGGTCTPNRFGYYCFSVQYGYLNAGTQNAGALDQILVANEKLRTMTSRRLAPVALNDKLFVSALNTEGASGQPHTYTLHRYNLSDASEVLPATVGRSFLTKTAERENGVFEGEVLAWDSDTKVLANVTGNVTNLGSPEGVISAAGDATAITTVFGNTSGVPLSGIGNLFALRGMPDSHNWHLMAGDGTTENGLDYVDQVPTSAWLYD